MRQNLRMVSMTDAVIVAPPELRGVERQAVVMLAEEVERRIGRRWPVVGEWPEEGRAAIGVGPARLLARFAGPLAASLGRLRAPGAEGYRLVTAPTARGGAAAIAGEDARGLLYGVGRLLRELRWDRFDAHLPADLALATAPRYPLRGHQLGYRPKTNSYDGWDVPQWEQYYRDLILFGANAIELIPPRSDDDADSPHFPRPPLAMMVEMSRLADAYGLDVWIWYPALDPDYSRPETVEFALKEWAEVFRALPRIDAVFVPGGDPGHTPPRHLLPLLEKQTASLRRFHPNATMWLSPQGFSAEWMEDFFRYVATERPDWLKGVVYGPQVRITLEQLRARLPERYPIRLYPDITHCLRCQYPVPDWDVAYALTLGREPINPRPRAQAAIFRQTAPLSCGFLVYSEGCNDDVNKIVWAALGWDPEVDVAAVLRQYSRCFLGERFEQSFAEGLLALEANWNGPLLANEGVEATLRHFQALERQSPPATRCNWRFQQALYRAYYDAYVRRRLEYETRLQADAMEQLRAAPRTMSLAAIAAAEAILDRAVTEPVATDLRARLFELAEALFQSIRMQLSVEKYQAIALHRGANLDAVDHPLNDRLWLKRRFAAIRALPTEAERLVALREIVHWHDPGPGGYYDDLGDPARRPHLVTGPGFPTDPEFKASALTGFATVPDGRLSWQRHAEALYDQPLRLRYTGLDPDARYRVRVIYGSERTRGRLRLETGNGHPLHEYRDKPEPGEPLTFPVPAAGIVGDTLELVCRREPGLGGNGRGAQICEIWLLREGGE